MISSQKRAFFSQFSHICTSNKKSCLIVYRSLFGSFMERERKTVNRLLYGRSIIYRHFADEGKAASLLFCRRLVLPGFFMLHWRCPMALIQEKSAVNKVPITGSMDFAPPQSLTVLAAQLWKKSSSSAFVVGKRT